MELATAVLLEGRTHALDRWVCTALRVWGNTASPYTVWASLQNASVLHGLHKDQGDAPALMARDWTWRCRSDPPIHWEGWGRSCGSTPTRELWGQLSPRRSNSSQDLPVALVLPCDPEAPRLTHCRCEPGWEAVWLLPRLCCALPTHLAPLLMLLHTLLEPERAISESLLLTYATAELVHIWHIYYTLT